MRVADPGFDSRLRRGTVSGSGHTCDSCLRSGVVSGLGHACDLQIGTPVAALPGAWRYRVSTGTGWPSVSGWVR